MQSSTAWIFFFLFGVVLFVSYVAMRRRWAAPGLISLFCVLASIIFMTLMALAQGNIIVQAVFVGLIVGGLFSAGTLVMAYYFTVGEQRKLSADGDGRQTQHEV